MSNGPSSSLERFREEVIEKLSASYSRDYLDQIEFEQRVEEATSATSHQELRKLIIDLPLAGSPDAPVPTGSGLPATRGEYIVPDSQASSESSVISIFSGSERKGVWSPPRTLNSICVFGGTDIDLREAKIPAGGITIHAVVMFGGVDVIVPDDLNVEVRGAGIFGAFDGKNHVASDNPATPTVKIDGIALFGGVDIKIKPRR